MKLSDIKGQASLDIMADAMELAEMVGDDPRFKALADDLRASAKDGEADDVAAARAICKHLPAILRDKGYQERIVSIFAAASGVPRDEYARDGAVLMDAIELFTSDAESLGFLLGSAAPKG